MVSVAAVDLCSGRRFERDAHVVMPAASTIKVLVSAALWSAVQRGELDPAGGCAWPTPPRPVAAA